jgi:xylulokinase
MPGSLLLGIDIGTYSAKGVLCEPDGRVLASATIEHALSLPRPGWAEHDPESIWWGEFAALSRRLLGNGFSGEDVGAVAVSAIGPCLLPVDRQGRPLRAGILYGVDSRATAEIVELTGRIGEAALLRKSGMVLTSQAVGPKILWLRRNEPDVFAATHRLLSSTSYIVYRLTGQYAIDRHTASYFNPLFDLSSMAWDDEYADGICDLAMLPGLYWSNDIAGEVTRQAAAETGLRPGTPVTAGTIDAAAEAISVGVRAPGDMMVMYGTTMFFILVADAPAPDPHMWATAFLFEGSYDVAGGMATSGALTRWFRDHLGQDLVRDERAGGANAYAALADEAAAISPGADGLICLPYFSGERTPINDPDARGIFAGLTLSHTRGHLYRAVLEGTGFGVRHNLETIAGMGAAPRRLVAVGGGAQNPLWMQIVSDITGVPQDLPAQTVGASYGDAFLAGLARGIVPSIDALDRDWVRIAQAIEPREEVRGIYDQLYPIYRSLYGHTIVEQHALSRLGAVAGS